MRGERCTNGVVKAIRGGKISDVNKNIQEIKNKPRNIVTQIGGNDLDDDKVTVENVSSEYKLLLTETRNRFPESNIIISGLPPRFNNDTIRAKVKQFNEHMRKWSEQNQIRYVDNEAPFEFRNGDKDTDSYVMTGNMPAIQLKRNATMRLLENLQKSIPALILSDKIHQTEGPKQTYAKVVTQSRSRAWMHDHIDRRYNQNTERQNVREGDTWQLQL